MSSSSRSSLSLPLLDGTPSPLKENQLPTIKDVLLDLLYEKMTSPSGMKTPFNIVKKKSIDKLISIYGKVPQTTVTEKTIETKLKNLHEEYMTAKKHPNNTKAKKFIEKSTKLFDISACKCPMQEKFSKGFIVCKCPPVNKIHEKEYNFMLDQRGARKMYLSAQIDVQTSAKYEETFVRRQLNHIRTPTTSSETSSLSPSASPSPLTRTRGAVLPPIIEDTEDDESKDKDFDPPPKCVKRVKLIDDKQSNAADKKGTSNRAVSLIVTNDSKKVNRTLGSDSQTVFQPASHMMVYRERVKERELRIAEMEEKINNIIGPVQIMFDGKKINNRERMVVILQHMMEGVLEEDFARLKTFDSDDSITGQRLFDAMVKELFNQDMLKKVISLMSDTTAVNTGCRQGINIRMKEYFNTVLGKDIHLFECLLHINELYLTHFIKEYEGLFISSYYMIS